MTKSDLEFLDDALRTYRFMMASAVSGKFSSNKDVSKYMAEAAKVQDRLSQEMKSLAEVVEVAEVIQTSKYLCFEGGLGTLIWAKECSEDCDHAIFMNLKRLPAFDKESQE